MTSRDDAYIHHFRCCECNYRNVILGVKPPFEMHCPNCEEFVTMKSVSGCGGGDE